MPEARRRRATPGPTHENKHFAVKVPLWGKSDGVFLRSDRHGWMIGRSQGRRCFSRANVVKHPGSASPHSGSGATKPTGTAG